MSEYVSAISSAVRTANPSELAYVLNKLHATGERKSDINPSLEKDAESALRILESNIAPAAIHTGTVESPALALFLAPDQLKSRRPERRLAFWQIRQAAPDVVAPLESAPNQWHPVSALIEFDPYRTVIPLLRPTYGLVDRTIFPQFFHQQSGVADLRLHPADQWYLLPNDNAVHVRIGHLPSPVEGLNGYWHERITAANQIPPTVTSRIVEDDKSMDIIFEQEHRLFRRGLRRRLAATDYRLHYEAASPALVQ